MYFPDDRMDINKFVAVHIPSKSSYLQKFGFTSSPSTFYTGDDFAPLPKDKIASIADMDAYDSMMAKYELENSEQNGS